MRTLLQMKNVALATQKRRESFASETLFLFIKTHNFHISPVKKVLVFLAILYIIGYPKIS